MRNLCLVALLLTFCSIQSVLADMADDYSGARNKNDGGKALQGYLQSLPPEKLLELIRELGKRRESEASEARKRNPARFIDDSVQAFFYEFASIESIRRKKAEAKMTDLMAILNGPSESNLLKRVLVEYYTSSQSPLGPEEKALLVSTLKKYLSQDSKTREILSRKETDLLHEALGRSTSPSNAGGVAPSQEEKIKALTPKANAHLREIMDDLASRASVDYHDAQRLCTAYLRYSRLGFPVDKAAVTQLSEQLYANPSKTDLDARILLANFLANDLEKKEYFPELIKMKTELTSQTLLRDFSPLGKPRADYLAGVGMRAIKDYDGAVDYIKSHGPADPLFDNCVVKLRRFRREMEKEGTWSKEKDKELLMVVEGLLEKSSSEAQKEYLRSWIRESNIRITGIRPTPATFGK